MNCPPYPALVYEYDRNGRYGSPLAIPNHEAMTKWMQKNLKRILRDKLELRITDMLDLMMFHCQDGKILYDGERHYPNGKPLPPGALDE